jgi:hypothetical protein
MTGDDFGHVPRPGFRDTPAPERVPCACGTDVCRQPHESIAVVVRRHNRSRVHRDWWERYRKTWT